MKIVVTGASGFVGYHVVSKLISLGYKVSSTSGSFRQDPSKKMLEQTNHHIYQLGTPMTKYDCAFFQDSDIVFHMAWEGLTDFRNEKHQREFLQKQIHFVNYLTTLGVKRLIVAGTCLEYGLKEGELIESMETNPIISYAIGKDQLRKYIETIETSFADGFCWIRLFYMYGAGQNPKSILPLLAHAISEKKDVFDMSDGEQGRDYLPVEQVAINIVKLALNKQAQGIVNCSDGKPTKIRNLVEDFIQKEGAEIRLNLGVYPYPDYEPITFWGNNEKMKQLLKNEI